MLLSNLMEEKPLTSSRVISSIKNFNCDENERGTIKAFLRNLILPDADKMAIKENQSVSNNYVYTIPVKPPIPTINRMKSMNEAKLAFLNSTVTSETPVTNKTSVKQEESNVYYAQIAITTESDDTRSTGGGNDTPQVIPIKTKIINNSNNVVDSSHNAKKKVEPQHRKVSFKIKNTATSYRRPTVATKTMTITGSKVSELTKKFNDLVAESHNGQIKQSKLARTIEDLQTASRCSVNDSSTISPTLSSSPNIKIVLRQRRGSKRRNPKKRCSSMDSIDKLIITDNTSNKIRVIRSKSDGIKIPKSPKKRQKYQDSSEHPSGSDSVDGTPVKCKDNQSHRLNPAENNVVKNVIKKFECEIIAQSNSNNTLLRKSENTKSTTPVKEKPKVPEKKSSLVLTKNLVVKDGVPKIKTIKPPITEITPKEEIKEEKTTKIVIRKTENSEEVKRKEPLYDKKKFKTNYIHSDKLPLKAVEIIQEDINEVKSTFEETQETSFADASVIKDGEKTYQDISPNITPNDSFLWRRKSSTQIYSDSDKSISDSLYSFISVTMNEVTFTCTGESSDIVNEEESLNTVKIESQISQPNSNIKYDADSDFECNLIEAYNNEVRVGNDAKPINEAVIEDDYEPLEPRNTDNVIIIPVKTIDRNSKLNCPLPEIPKETTIESQVTVKENPIENIYQCLLEMRSHPEGDESSIHNYESCDKNLEERTRGDGDSDDGYEYCKPLIKPYCLTGSSGIQIAEDYRPSSSEINIKNYAISKSVSGASTVSYEKIGSERIYEKIPARQSKSSKDSSPCYSSQHSTLSSDYTGYNDTDNIYYTIKHADGASISHFYESIPNSPSVVKLRNNLRRQLSSAAHKRLSFNGNDDAVSNISQSTMSSEQKTNSIYGQRSVISFNGQEIAFHVPSSETSVSDRSDRSDDWVDVSDEEKNEQQKIIILRERNRGRKSPISWSQKVRHQWHKTTTKSTSDDKECDSSDSGHVYELLEPAPAPQPAPIDDDIDSFASSDSDFDEHDKSPSEAPPLPSSRLPSPPSGGQYTLTKIASAAHRKMRQIKRNLTKRYTAMDKPFSKSQSNSTYDTPKTTKTQIYANHRPNIQHPYSNIDFHETRQTLNKTENPVTREIGFKGELTMTREIGFKEELMTALSEKRLSNGDVPPPLPEKNVQEKPSTPTESKKDSGTLSRKAYFSFKSPFRRPLSMAVDSSSEIPSALKITNSTFYLMDSMDGDSGFSNCSDSAQTGSMETLPKSRRRDGMRGPSAAESTPCLALQRPPEPPPPPPALAPAPTHTDISAVNEELKRLLPSLSRKDKSPRTRSSWYADSGSDTVSIATSNTSWYAEVGLVPAGHVSSSSGASSGSHPASPLPHSLFTHEPLYQFYNAAKVESVCRETGDSDSDAYETSSGAPSGEASTPAARPSAMALVAPRGPARTLWCEVPEVVNSAVLSSLAPAQKRLQEAKFELLTSEASYLNSLNVLETHFIAHPAFRDPHVLPREDWETLFATILPVRKCSQLLMNELERCWQENILLTGICEVVRRHAERHFAVYVRYCAHQALMVRALQRLRDTPAFAQALKRMEAQPACQSLSLHSFLMLPMQRVTRLPLLMDAVLRHLPPADHEYQPCVRALTVLNHFVSQCNEGARNTERVEEMFRLSQIIEFPPNVKDPPLLGPALNRRTRRPVRWLVRSGEMTQLVWKADELKLTFGKKFHKVPLHLFLFNDLLVITKKKSEECYLAVDHCARSLLEVCDGETVTAAARHALLLTLLENRDGRTLEMLMSVSSETEASRWSEALRPPSAGAGEAVYAGWDCPQVAALYHYHAAQPDELALAEGDVVNVTRKTAEGWYYGERTRDGEQGWFPGAYTAEIASAHVRARNLRQRYRLLALSATYLGQRRKL